MPAAIRMYSIAVEYGSADNLIRMFAKGQLDQVGLAAAICSISF